MKSLFFCIILILYIVSLLFYYFHILYYYGKFTGDVLYGIPKQIQS